MSPLRYSGKKPCRGRVTIVTTLQLILILILVLGSCSPVSGSSDKKSDRRDASVFLAVKPEILNPESNPTLRYPVMHWYGAIWSVTYGWLDISRDSVRYEVQHPPKKADHGFISARSAVAKIKWQGDWLKFEAAGKGHHLIYLPPERWDTVHTGFGMSGAGSQYSAFTAAVAQALQNFAHVLALVKPPPPPAPPKLETKPQPGVVAPPPAPPTIILLDPLVGASSETIQVKNATLSVRGIATDTTSLPMVTINGTPANMKPRSAQAVEFWSDPFTLESGQNPFEIIATNSAKASARFRFVALYTPPPMPAPSKAQEAAPPAVPRPTPNPKALNKNEILDLLRSYVPSARVAGLVRERGIKFSPTQEDLDEIVGAGGADDLIEAVRDAGSHRNDSGRKAD